MRTAANTRDVRAKLEGERQLIAAEIAALIEADRRSESDRATHAGGASDIAEGASETFEHDNSLALQRSLRATQAQIEHAVTRLEQGTYGVCEACGSTIAAERLEAIPYATLCVACKATREPRRFASPSEPGGPSSTAAA